MQKNIPSMEGQLKSFNHPYQLGWTGVEFKSEGESKSFKMAADFSTVHIRRGGIIIRASDSLFDNVDIDDMSKLNWNGNEKIISSTKPAILVIVKIVGPRELHSLVCRPELYQIWHSHCVKLPEKKV